ncbi:hypothetical protein CL628_04350 [bacterium]|nr:hypothetical protein [bacterium]
MHNFMQHFNFNPDRAFWIGVERERLIADRNGAIVPWAERILKHLGGSDRFTYEMSACQVEDHVGPCPLDQVMEGLTANNRSLSLAETALQFRQFPDEVGPEKMPLDVYPDPTGRYQQIAPVLKSEGKLLAACQVAGTHIHVGMPNHETALRVYNGVIDQVDRLCDLGDHSAGERMRIYRIVRPDFTPPPFPSWEVFHEYALEQGFAENPRDCWNMIRMSRHGTIEFRMFGVARSLKEVFSWAEECHDLCRASLTATV